MGGHGPLRVRLPALARTLSPMGRQRPSESLLAAWCAGELDLIERLPWQQRGEALLRLLVVLVTRLADEHGEDELGAVVGRLTRAFGEYLGTDVATAALDSWARAVEPIPGEPLHGPPDWTEADLQEESVDRWYALDEMERADDDESADADGNGPGRA